MASRMANVNEATVEERVLPGDLLGFYDADRHLIVLDSRLLAAERRCTLMHERIHAERRDRADGPTEWHDLRCERVVATEAARRLIPLPALIDALRWSNRDEEVAEQLDVDLDTLRCRSANLTSDECVAIEAALYDECQSA